MMARYVFPSGPTRRAAAIYENIVDVGGLG
jgi:hypothetical protein